MPVFIPINESNVGVMPYNQNVWVNITTDAELVSYKHNYRIKIGIGSSEESSSEFFKENDKDYSYYNLNNPNPHKTINHMNDDSKMTNIYLPFIIAFSVIYRYEIINYMGNPSDQNKAILKKCLKELGRKAKYNNTTRLKDLADDAWMLRNPGQDPNKMM